MPIDINSLRVDRGGDPAIYRSSQKKRFANVDLIDRVLALDVQWKAAQSAYETNKMNGNALQQEIKLALKAKQDNAKELIAKRKAIAAQDGPLKAKAEALMEQVTEELNKVANLIDASVPISQNEDDNEILCHWGTPRKQEMILPSGGEDVVEAEPLPKLKFHHELLHRIDGYEPERGVQTAGHRAYFLKGVAVRLNLALQTYGQDFLEARQFTALQPPYFVNKSNMSGVAQLEDFDESLYKIQGSSSEEDEKYLIATSEQPLCCYHKGDWIEESALPLRYAGISTCFRKESGSHGRDTWGIFRVHRFDKVEQFCVTDPDHSKAMHEEMIQNAKEFYESLGLPYRVVNLVSGELNNAATKKYDLEGWFPAYGEYRELVSCSNCTDYQSRAMEIRCGTKKMNQTEKKYVHLLNGTLVATSRTICCILENYQEDDGIRVPDVLIPYMGGKTFLPFIRNAKENLQAKKGLKAKAKKT